MGESGRAERRSRLSKEKKKDDGLFAVGLCQAVFAVIIVLFVLIVSKSSGQAAQNLRDDFSLLMSVSYDKNDVEKTWKSVKNYFSSPPNLSVFRAFYGEKEETSETEESLTEQTETAVSETEKETEPIETSEAGETSSAPQKEEKEEKAGESPAVAKTNLGLSLKAETPIGLNSGKTQTSSVEETSEQIIMPVNGIYTSYFGMRTNPITGQDSLHTGLDIAAAQGTKIKAACSGVVRKVGEDSRSGKYIYLTHEDGAETLYCHCSAVLAEQGASIRQGETIALVGSTGWSTGPHLHFEFHKNGKRLDPLPLLNRK